jgi:hypothetical protein
VLQVEELDDLLDLAAELAARRAHRAGEQQVLHPAGMAVAVAADQQVLQHGGVLEQLDVLEGAGDAQRAISCGGMSVKSSRPRSDAAGGGPVERLIRLKTVVLPAPLGPISVNTSPGRTSKLTRC